MRLINEKQFTLFIDHTVTFTNEGGVVEKWEGKQVWEEFKNLMLNKKLDYAERIFRLSQTKEKMAYFTYSYGVQHNSQVRYPRHLFRKDRVVILRSRGRTVYGVRRERLKKIQSPSL